MKLIVQIPCFNEEETLLETIEAIPRSFQGIETVELLVIDDGSTDNTVLVAQNSGVDHIIRVPQNRGLANAFTTGLEACIQLGADIIVNTDADNQYYANDISRLIEPILLRRADFVIGERPIRDIDHFSWTKKFLQGVGSNVVRSISSTEIGDAPSGFRAISRDAAMRLNVFSEYTYTLETIIQAGQVGIAIESVPIRVNGETRPSRLVKNIPAYIKRSITTIFRIFITYRPMRSFLLMAFVIFGTGFVLGLRFVFYYLTGDGSGHIQSVILSALLMGSGLVLGVLALLADLIAVNRRLLEKIRYRLYKIDEQLNKRS